MEAIISSTVLVITNDHDEHVDAVIEELDRRAVRVFRFNPEEFTRGASISSDGGRSADAPLTV